MGYVSTFRKGKERGEACTCRDGKTRNTSLTKYILFELKNYKGVILRTSTLLTEVKQLITKSEECLGKAVAEMNTDSILYNSYLQKFSSVPSQGQL